uniref:Uncharacterized protein n=1 Tax=Romanomermis culicivorax TaxID=13658 RepID=A0A915HWC1_ROMCU
MAPYGATNSRPVAVTPFKATITSAPIRSKSFDDRIISFEPDAPAINPPAPGTGSKLLAFDTCSA